MRRWLTVAALGLAAIVKTHAQAPVTAPPSGLILGRVVDAVTQQPVGGAVVRLNASTPQQPVLTGADGQFLFTGLAPGLYGIVATKPGYLDGGFGQKRPRGEGTVLELKPRERAGDIVVTLWPWGTITGRITTTDGVAAIGVEVDAIRRGPNGSFGARVSSALTDSSGAYAIPRLAPGQYVVAVICRSRRVQPTASEFTNAVGLLSPPMRCNSPLGVGFGPSAFEPAFYLGAAEPAGATQVAVRAGEIVEGIDITLTPVPGYRIAGTLIGPSGPLVGARVRLVRGGWNAGDIAVHHEAQSTSSGAFTFAGVTPGHYSINSQPNAPHWIEQPVTIDHADVADLVVRTHSGIRMSGQIDIGRPLTDPIAFELTMHRDRLPVESDAAGSFSIPDVPPGRFQFYAASVTRRWRLVSATLGGREILGSYIDVGNEHVQGLVLRFTDQPSRLEGSVIDPRMAPLKDATIVVFPADASLWPAAREDSPLFRSQRTLTGQFAFEDLHLGEHIVAAVDDAVMEDWPDARLLARLAAIGQRVRVVLGQQLRRDLRVEQIR